MKRIAFTLAEMMVVMLILTIVLAAFAPLMTKRKNVDLSSSPWKYTTNNSDIYYGLGSNQTAMIGQNEQASTDLSNRLTINTSSNTQNHILFKQGTTSLGSLLLSTNNNIILGNPSNSLTGSSNTAIGSYALTNNTTGYDNTASGSYALQNNNEGYSNTATGYLALTSNKKGYSNTATGNSALFSNTTGNYNTATGEGALSISTTGSYNTATGQSALSSSTTGSYNTAIGHKALFSSTTGSYNTAVGYNACKNVTGANKTCIGQDSGPALNSSEASDSVERIYIGGTSNMNGERGIIVVNNPKDLTSSYVTNYGKDKPATSVVINGALVVHGPIINPVKTNGAGNHGHGWSFLEVMSGDNDKAIWSYGRAENSPYLSDKRLKNIISENKSGLEQIRQLKVYDYIFKDDTSKYPQVGVMAQDLQKIFPNAVFKSRDTDYLKIRQDEMFYAVINSIKQLDILIQGLINEIKVVLNKITTFDKEIKKLQKENAELKIRLEKLEKAIF